MTIPSNLDPDELSKTAFDEHGEWGLLARTLERELNEAKTKSDELHNRLQAANNENGYLNIKLRDMTDQFFAVSQDRERLFDENARLILKIDSLNEQVKVRGDMRDEAIQEMNKALQSLATSALDRKQLEKELNKALEVAEEGFLTLGSGKRTVTVLRKALHDADRRAECRQREEMP